MKGNGGMFVMRPQQSWQIMHILEYRVLMLYSGFYLQGPNFCEICKVLTSSQILILKLLLLSWTSNEACYTSPWLSQKS